MSDELIGYVNRYKGQNDAIWSGRTIFASFNEAKSVPCASRDAYVDTCELRAVREISMTPTIQAMQRHGGHFVRSLAAAWLAADESNRERIQAAFPELWIRYARIAALTEVTA
jgi:hypothetical protein